VALAPSLELGRDSGFSDRNAHLSAHSEPLSFANLASLHPHVNGYQTLDHIGTALTQQIRSVLFAFAEVAVHFDCFLFKAAGSPELIAFYQH
jgi:hypothetical protein